MMMIRARFRCRKHNIRLSGHPHWISVEVDDVEFVPSMSMMWCPANGATYMERDHCDETNWVAELTEKF